MLSIAAGHHRELGKRKQCKSPHRVTPPSASDAKHQAWTRRPTQVDLMIVMNARVQSWEDKLPKGMQDLLYKSRNGE